jgi:endonuclease/exonuclease/phosphatase family metal-dependent hydrolase
MISLEERFTPPPTDLELHALIRRELAPHFRALARLKSTAELRTHPLYPRIEPVIRRVLATPEVGSFAPGPAPARPRYRLLAWNLERGIELDGQIAAFRTHPYFRTADVLLLTETDVGMARSGNRAVAREIAAALGMHYAFIPSYINLSKGAGVEHHARGENELGLHGNALLSRYPFRRVWPIALENGKDKMTGREKRLGVKQALAAEIEFPNLRLVAVTTHLDAQSTREHRRDQLADVIDGIGPRVPAVIGGDWNTSTYNSSRAFPAILGFWRRVFMGVDHVIWNHYLHPYARFEKELFALLEARGFDYRRSNQLGEPTLSYDIADLKTRRNLGEWVPGWCFAFIRWALRNHGGRCPLKLDWFATRGLGAENPVVIRDVDTGTARPLSDHDAIGIDVVV